MINDRTRLVDATVGDLVEYLRTSGVVKAREEERPAIRYQGADYVYKLDGLAKVLGCSRRKAQRVKDSGKYKEAIRQDGRVIVTDVRKLMSLMANEP